MGIEFDQVVDSAIRFNKEHREHLISDPHVLSDILAIKFMCTVSINLGRCTGKTDYISRRAKTGDLVIEPTMGNLPLFRKMFSIRQEKPTIFVPWRDLNSLRGLYPPETIYIDEPHLCPAGILEDVIRAYGPRFDIKRQTVVMLGE